MQVLLTLHGRSIKSSVEMTSECSSKQDPSPSIAQFGQEARSRKSPGCFKLHPLRIMDVTRSCEH